MKQSLKITIFSLLLTSFVWANADTAQAAAVAPQPCDTAYWETLTSRAWMEAEREIMQNQNLIFKADSVLEYACFDRFVGHHKNNAPEIFSTDEFLLPALESVVDSATGSYLEANFSHLYLGNRAVQFESDPEDRVPLDFAPQDYVCEEMAGVWRAAKCANFIHHPDFEETDGFYPFNDLLGFDGSPDIEGYTANGERRFYADPPCQGPAVGGAQLNEAPTDWGPQFNISINDADIQYPFAIPLNDVFVDVGRRLAPGECTEAILTGVQVITSNGAGGDDGVCSNPGCSFVGGGCQ